MHPPAGRLLLSAGAAHDGQLCLWDWAAGALLARVAAHVAVLGSALSADGGLLLCGGKEQLKVR